MTVYRALISFKGQAQEAETIFSAVDSREAALDVLRLARAKLAGQPSLGEIETIRLTATNAMPIGPHGECESTETSFEWRNGGVIVDEWAASLPAGDAAFPLPPLPRLPPPIPDEESEEKNEMAELAATLRLAVKMASEDGYDAPPPSAFLDAIPMGALADDPANEKAPGEAPKANNEIQRTGQCKLADERIRPKRRSRALVAHAGQKSRRDGIRSWPAAFLILFLATGVALWARLGHGDREREWIKREEREKNIPAEKEREMEMEKRRRMELEMEMKRKREKEQAPPDDAF